MRSDLRIIGPEVTPPDFLTLRPSFSANVTPGGVHIPWKFDGNSKWLEVLRLEVDSSDGKGFVHLTYDTTPGYTDPPQPTTLTQLRYRGIYLRNTENNPLFKPYAAQERKEHRNGLVNPNTAFEVVRG